MIAKLEGVRETVNFKEDSKILLFDNTDYEEYPIHWHTPIEIIVPLEGIYRLECNKVPITLNKGDVAIIAPGVLHKLHADHGRRIIFQIDLSLLQAFKEIETFITSMGPIVVVTPSDYPEIHSRVSAIMNDIFEEYFSVEAYREIAIYSKFLELFTMVARSSCNRECLEDYKPTKISEYNETFFGICEYINNHCTEDLSLDEIAEMAGFSKYHFSRLFKEFTNNSYYKYLNARKISYAEQLLMDPTKKITEVAIACGFNSVSAFLRMFKSIRGCTPTEYRDLHRK